VGETLFTFLAEALPDSFDLSGGERQDPACLVKRQCAVAHPVEHHAPSVLILSHGETPFSLLEILPLKPYCLQDILATVSCQLLTKYFFLRTINGVFYNNSLYSKK
jgi:hypothetical protein